MHVHATYSASIFIAWWSFTRQQIMWRTGQLQDTWRGLDY